MVFLPEPQPRHASGRDRAVAQQHLRPDAEMNPEMGSRSQRCRWPQAPSQSPLRPWWPLKNTLQARVPGPVAKFASFILVELINYDPLQVLAAARSLQIDVRSMLYRASGEQRHDTAAHWESDLRVIEWIRRRRSGIKALYKPEDADKNAK